MTNVQTWIILTYGLLSFLAFLGGLIQVIKKHNPFGETHFLSWLGIFVWGDAVVIGFFWVLASLLALFLQDWYLFCLIVSVFWVVRSLGETNYWIAEQFSPIVRNKPQNLWGYRFFKNDSIWFVYQISWQCSSVVAVIATIYFANQWLGSFS